MFDDSPSLTLRMIGWFSMPWFYGHGWFAPVYYGALFALALWVRRRYEMAWKGHAPIYIFVFGISGAYGGLCAALISIRLIPLAQNFPFNPIFLSLTLVNFYAFQALVRSVIAVCKNEIKTAGSLLFRGLFLVAPSIFLLILFGAAIANMH